jgi:hypothetical protein
MEFKTFVFYFLLGDPGVCRPARDHLAQSGACGAVSGPRLFSASGVWMLLQAEFLAIALILVYVGAVMVLFLFVVMMLDINLDRLREGFWSYSAAGLDHCLADGRRNGPGPRRQLLRPARKHACRRRAPNYSNVKAVGR